MAETEAGRGSPGGRIALLAAAVVAVAAVGFSVWQRPSAAPTAIATPQSAAPADAAKPPQLAELEAATKASPKDADAWRRLGAAYRDAEKFAAAAEAYTHAVTLEPKNGPTWSALGEALIYTGTADQPFRPEAIAAFHKAVEIDPTDPRARYFLAYSRDLNGDHKGAIDEWLALLKETPPGAPWEAGLRKTIIAAGARNNIEVASRMAARPASPPAGAAASGPSDDQVAAIAALSPQQREAMVRSMVDSLAAKLKANPKDADGWLQLMQARMVLGQSAEAGRALADARSAFAGDAATLARITREAGKLAVPGA